MSYYSNVRDGNYTGDDALVRECFTQAHRLRDAARQMKVFLAAGKEIKGTLNEQQYDDRLAENRNSPVELHRIVATQEHRRSEYFRTRMLLQHHILPTVKDSLQRVSETSRQIASRIEPKEQWGTRRLSHDEVSALCETQSVVQGENVVELFARARDFVAEPDETNGRGEKAFERACKSNDSWHDSLIPAEYQVIDGWDAHPLDLALQAAIAELLPKLVEFENDVAALKRLDPRNRESGVVTLQDRARWPELFSRVNRRMQHGDKYSVDGYDPGFREVEGKPVTDAAEALRVGLETITVQPQRWLAQSNLLGLTRRVFSQLLSLETDGFNLTVGACCIYEQVYKDTVKTGFGQLIARVDEVLPSL